MAVVTVRVVDMDDADNILDEYESPVTPRAGEILAWSPDSGDRPVYRVVEVRHWRGAMRDGGITFIGLLVLVDTIPYEDRWATR